MQNCKIFSKNFKSISRFEELQIIPGSKVKECLISLERKEPFEK